MYNSKLYTILEHFDKYEQNRCRKYIQSPYFNRSEELVKLFEILAAAINGENGANLEKEYVWSSIQPGKEYDDVRFRKYCSDLLKLVEGYLSQQTFENKPIFKATFLMEAIGKKKMEKLYNSSIRSARRFSRQQPYRSANFYYQQYKIEQNYYDLTEFETKRFNRSNIEDIANNLDIFYLAEKLRMLCAVISQKNLTSTLDYKLLFIDDIINHVKQYNFDKYPPVALYYQIYLTLTESENVEHYYKLKNLLDKYGLNFPPGEAKDVLYMAAQNYCIRKINQGNQEFMTELFLLYKDLISKEILIAEGELSPWYFNNIVNIALRLGEYSWAEKFINDYQSHLPETYRNNAVTFNLAQVYFYQKDYDKVIEQLRNVEYDDVSYNLNSKTMLLATYYEIDEIEPLYSLLESFRTYLNRHKDIPANKRRRYLNLIKYTKKLTRIIPGDEKAITKVKQDIEGTKGIVSLNWLKEKIAELE